MKIDINNKNFILLETNQEAEKAFQCEIIGQNPEYIEEKTWTCVPCLGWIQILKNI